MGDKLIVGVLLRRRMMENKRNKIKLGFNNSHNSTLMFGKMRINANRMLFRMM